MLIGVGPGYNVAQSISRGNLTLALILVNAVDLVLPTCPEVFTVALCNKIPSQAWIMSRRSGHMDERNDHTPF